MFNAIAGFFTGKVRLVIEYAMIAVILSLAGFAWYSAHERESLSKSVVNLSGQIGSLSESLNSQVDVNHAQDKAINTLTQLRVIDSDSMSALQDLLSDTTKQSAAVRINRARLEKSDAATKDILDRPVPAALACVLDQRPCAAPSDHPNSSGAGKPAESTDGSMRGSTK